MGLVKDLLAAAVETEVVDASLGVNWTGVSVCLGGGERCGLAGTLWPKRRPGTRAPPPVVDAGVRGTRRARELAERVPRGGLEASLGFAALHATIPLHPGRWTDENADRALVPRSAGKRTVSVSRFGFASQLREDAASVEVLELDPQPGEVAAERAAEVRPLAELIVITGMALVNRTLEDLLPRCPPQSGVALVGPSVPMCGVLFDYGVDLLCGAFVDNRARVMAGVRQGADFHPLHRLGVRLVTMEG